jgi:sporulation protein YlmC with PRC-barrel domain
MSKSITFVVMVFAISALFTSQTYAAAEGMKKGSMHESSATENHDMTSGTLRATEVKGATVDNKSGERLGSVEDLVIGRDGRVEYLILSSTAVPSASNKLFAIPWEAVKPGRTAETFTVDITKDRLAKAPSFEKGNWPDFASRETMREYHGYYMSGSERGAHSGSNY